MIDPIITNVNWVRQIGPENVGMARVICQSFAIAMQRDFGYMSLSIGQQDRHALSSGL